ncbi:MAG TPA: hypothetical protein VKX29_01760, partial [Brumimicrobium sp.]|nr:hypothetical protein [Brumimicrobium sp.]
MVDQIKFGTDGWRAVIGDTYTVNNIARVAEGTALWIKQQSNDPSIVIGHDCRFNGELFMKTAIKVYLSHGIKVYYAEGFVSTPMVSMGTKKYNADIGVVLTASHNPASYGGYKLKSNFGGPLLPDKIQEVEDLIPDNIDKGMLNVDIDDAIKSNRLIEVDLESEYIAAVKENFDIEAIKKSGLNLAFDAMYGSGQNVLKPLFPDMHFLHCEHNPGFMGQAPEPIAKNLKELEAFIKANGTIDAALATDGDADRIGLYGKLGEFIDSHHIILLLIHYMVKYKGMSGKVITAFSCSPKIAKMCEHYGLEH